MDQLDLFNIEAYKIIDRKDLRPSWCPLKYSQYWERGFIERQIKQLKNNNLNKLTSTYKNFDWMIDTWRKALKMNEDWIDVLDGKMRLKDFELTHKPTKINE